MSCEQRSNRIARLVGQVGIDQLANKRAFYAGLALGGLGLMSTSLVLWARRKNDPKQLKRAQVTSQMTPSDENQPEQKRRQENQMQPLPQLQTRTKVKPLSRLSPRERCAKCRVSGGQKPGAWYRLNGKTYCPDCTPEAAQAAKIELVLPETQANGTEASASIRSPVRPSQAAPAYLPPERRVKTRLVPSRVRLNVGRDLAGEPVWFVVEQGQVVVRANGLDTGLALTPALKIGKLRNGVQEVEEDPSRWWITHIPSGKTLGTQPYGTLETAHLLSSVLAQVDWTREEAEIGAEEIRQVRETVRRFNQALAEAQVEGQEKDTPTRPQLSPPATGEALVGKLVADSYGGVSRVLDVSADGETLFVIDNLGQRYEVTRAEVRLPEEQDFEMCRVARSFDPAQQPETACARCGHSSRRPESGERWYRMGGQSFCRPCATEYAAEEGYIKDEEISSELETMV